MHLSAPRPADGFGRYLKTIHFTIFHWLAPDTCDALEAEHPILGSHRTQISPPRRSLPLRAFLLQGANAKQTEDRCSERPG